MRPARHLLAVRGDLLERLGRHEEAAAAFESAATLTRNDAERAILLRRARLQSGTPDAHDRRDS